MEDRLQKGRHAINAVVCIGLHEKGINYMAVSIPNFRAIVIPVITYGCEVWI